VRGRREREVERIQRERVETCRDPKPRRRKREKRDIGRKCSVPREKTQSSAEFQVFQVCRSREPRPSVAEWCRFRETQRELQRNE